MANEKLSDAEAKEILRRWPRRIGALWPQPQGGYWLRALPKNANATHPTLSAPGANQFKTQPDGMYLYLRDDYADAVCIEVCGTIQNLNDKRSRYMPSCQSLVVRSPKDWLLGPLRIQRGTTTSMWLACDTLQGAPTCDHLVPIRYLSVLYALPNRVFDVWAPRHTPSGHEFFCKHSALDSYNAQPMQDFLGRMSLGSHFYGEV